MSKRFFIQIQSNTATEGKDGYVNLPEEYDTIKQAIDSALNRKTDYSIDRINVFDMVGLQAFWTPSAGIVLC